MSKKPKRRLGKGLDSPNTNALPAAAPHSALLYCDSGPGHAYARAARVLREAGAPNPGGAVLQVSRAGKTEGRIAGRLPGGAAQRLGARAGARAGQAGREFADQVRQAPRRQQDAGEGAE